MRHAPSLPPGHLFGRTDAPADTSSTDRISWLRTQVGMPGWLAVSPAQRCLQTAQTIWPDRQPDAHEPRVWEQDFGQWEGLQYADIPQIGDTEGAGLADFAPPGGESFRQMCTRMRPALEQIAQHGRRSVLVAHAGTVRAALALALSSVEGALRFDVATLSISRFRVLDQGGLSVISVNECPGR